MATFVVCTRCSKTREISAPDELPKGWKRIGNELRCASCTDTDTEAESDVLDEEVIYPSTQTPIDESFEDTLDEGYCEVCDGPCQGH